MKLSKKELVNLGFDIRKQEKKAVKFLNKEKTLALYIDKHQKIHLLVEGMKVRLHTEDLDIDLETLVKLVDGEYIKPPF